MAKRRGDNALLKKIVTELEKEYQGMDYLSQARELPGPLPVSEKSKYTIGIILPSERGPPVFRDQGSSGHSTGNKGDKPSGENTAHHIGHSRLEGKSEGG